VNAHNEKVFPNASQLLFMNIFPLADIQSSAEHSPNPVRSSNPPLIRSPYAFKNTFHSAARINSTTQDRRFITKVFLSDFLPLTRALFSASPGLRAKYLLASITLKEATREIRMLLL
jgi:hypothetical protein